jgi:hypothetical protein
MSLAGQSTAGCRARGGAYGRFRSSTILKISTAIEQMLYYILT